MQAWNADKNTNYPEGGEFFDPYTDQILEYKETRIIP